MRSFVRIGHVRTISFKGKIIDAHMHHGHWKGKAYSAEHLDKFVSRRLNVSLNGANSVDTIDKVVISSLNSIGATNRLSEVAGLRESIEMFGSDKKFGILAVAQPNLTEGNSRALRREIDANPGKVVGLKFHPTDLCETKDGQIVSIKPEWYDSYLKLAEDKRLPCLFHSDAGRSRPKDIYELAKKHKDTPIVLGHCGGGAFDEALDVMKKSLDNKDSKIYCDISWLDWDKGVNHLPAKHPTNVIRLIKELKAKEGGLDRILFGTDAPLGCYGQDQASEAVKISEKEAYELTVSNLKSEIKRTFGSESDKIIDKIFYDNANALYFQNGRIEQQVKKLSKTKLGFALGIVLALGCMVVHALKAHNTPYIKR